ncbi:MAG: TetR/AcrR family transcriptional regulator, partial [Clostridia bacterium]
FYGARVDDIAAGANINKRMIYEYFGNKDALYEQVLLHVYDRLEVRERTLLGEGLHGSELIRAIISMYFDFLHGNPTFVNIMMWENLCRAQHLKVLQEGQVVRPTLADFVSEIERGKAQGVFRVDIDARQVAISLITICFSNFSNRYTLSRLFDCDLESDAFLQIRKAHTIGMLLTYMTKE